MEYLFTSERLGFRTWQSSDIPVLASMLADDRVMEFYPDKKSLEETTDFVKSIDKHFNEHGYGLYATDMLKTGEFIGYIGFKRFDFDVPFAPGIEIGWRTSADTWGQGLATEGAKACLTYAWETLGFERVYSFTAVPNKRSERVMQKIGMEKTGEFDHPKLDKGHWLERHVLYEILRPSHS